MFAACGPTPLQQDSSFGPYLVLSGPTEAPMQADAALGGAVVWLVQSGPDEVRQVFHEVPVVVRPSGPALVLTGPPPATGTREDIEAISDEGPVAVGVAMLLSQPADAATLDLPSADVVAQIRGDEPMWGATLARSGVVGIASSVLVGLAGEEVTGPPAGPWCRLSQLEPGLVAYRETTADCGGWQPVAPAGDREEIQGVVWEDPARL